MEKRLWRDVLKSVSNGAANPNSGALRTLQQYYTKVLLPYECHIKNVDITACLSKLENSVSLHSSIGSPGSQLSSSDNERVNHYPHLSSVDSNSVESLSDLRVNGEGEEHQQKKNKARTEQRLNSQGSDVGLVNSGGGHESQMSSGNATPDGHGTLSQQQSQSLGMEQGSQHQSDTTTASLVIPEGSQNSLDNYSQVITEPLPEMSVQDAESVLGMSPAPYPNQQQQPGGPATPSAIQNAPSPSQYPSHFPHHPPTVTPSGGPAPPPSTPGATQDYMEMSEMGRSSTPGMPTNPPLYPPSYPMDPMSGYPQSHPPSMPPGYHHPYNSPSAHGQYDMSHDFHHRMQQSTLMRQPYANGSPHYPGMPPSMPLPGHIPPSMEYPGYRSSVMPPHAAAMGMREIPPYPGPPGMSPEWQWRRQQQLQQHRSRVIPPLPAHLHSSSAAYQSSFHERRQQAMLAALHAQQQQQHHMHNRGSPGSIPSAHSGSSDAIKIHWQDQNRTGSPSQLNKMQEKTSALAKQALGHKMDASSENKSLSSKTMEQVEMLKRQLPDWSNCVEGTKPHLVKRRRLFSGDCGEG